MSFAELKRSRSNFDKLTKELQKTTSTPETKPEINAQIIDSNSGSSAFNFTNDGGKVWDFGTIKEGDLITVDANQQLLQLNIEDSEIEKRRSLWEKPKPRYTSGILGKYSRLVGSSSKGAVTDRQ